VGIGINGANNIATSPDGVTWTPVPTPVTALLSAVTWSPEQAEFVAVGQGGVLSSPDGVTWTPVTDPAPGNIWDSVVWSAARTNYVAVSSSGTLRTMVGIVPAPVTPPTTGGAATPSPALASTGENLVPFMAAGFLALLVGAGILLARRRRA
jgi:LPXTG-motif cell wall-anchored protein